MTGFVSVAEAAPRPRATADRRSMFRIVVPQLSACDAGHRAQGRVCPVLGSRQVRPARNSLPSRERNDCSGCELSKKRSRCGLRALRSWSLQLVVGSLVRPLAPPRIVLTTELTLIGSSAPRCTIDQGLPSLVSACEMRGQEIAYGGLPRFFVLRLASSCTPYYRKNRTSANPA